MTLYGLNELYSVFLTLIKKCPITDLKIFFICFQFKPSIRRYLSGQSKIKLFIYNFENLPGTIIKKNENLNLNFFTVERCNL